MCHISGRSVIESYLATVAKQDPALAIPSDRMLAFELERGYGNQPARWQTYLVEPTSAITGDSIASAVVDPPERDDPEAQLVRIELDRAGTEVLEVARPTKCECVTVRSWALARDGSCARLYLGRGPPTALT